jgi:hypothetical protein
LGIHGINDEVLPFYGGVALANKFVGVKMCQLTNIGKSSSGSGGLKLGLALDRAWVCTVYFLVIKPPKPPPFGIQ